MLLTQEDDPELESGLPLIEYDAIVISDIHLGSPLCQAKELAAFLSQIQVRYLILAGDIFDDLRFNRLRHWHWEVLSRIRNISGRSEVIWIRGNHDIVSASTMSHLLGVEVLDEFRWTLSSKTFYAIHGDQWDTFVYKHQRLSILLSRLYAMIQRLHGGVIRTLARWLRIRARLFNRNTEAVKFAALDHAKREKIDAIFCGHTHSPALLKSEGIVYGNDGTWQAAEPHFLGISGTRVDLCKYKENNAIVVKSEWLKDLETEPDMILLNV